MTDCLFSQTVLEERAPFKNRSLCIVPVLFVVLVTTLRFLLMRTSSDCCLPVVSLLLGPVVGRSKRPAALFGPFSRLFRR
jgi:hypothetical protein